MEKPLQTATMIDTEKLLFVYFCALTPKAYFTAGTDSWAAPEAEESILGYDESLQITTIFIFRLK